MYKMRKKISLITTLLLISLHGISQTLETISGETCILGEKETCYRYKYEIKENSFQLNLIDSIICIHCKNNIEVIRKFSNKGSIYSQQEIIKNAKGLDSISNWYNNNSLLKTEQFIYSRQGLLSRSKVDDLVNPEKSGYYRFIHKDSITNEGKVSTTIAFKAYARLLHGQEYQIKTYYNPEGDTLRIVRIDDKGEEELYSKYRKTRKNKRIINYQQTIELKKGDLNNHSQFITRYLELVKTKLKDKYYTSLEYHFQTEDTNVVLHIKKSSRFNSQQAIITVKENYKNK